MKRHFPKEIFKKESAEDECTRKAKLIKGSKCNELIKKSCYEQSIQSVRNSTS